MNNSYDSVRAQEARAEREARRLLVRTRVLMSLFCAALAGFLAVLFQTQIVNGQDYLNNASHRLLEAETVDSARGEILDCYGRVLVANKVSYNVELDTNSMGERRDEVLQALLALCREEGVSWDEALPISDQAPWTFTGEDPLYISREKEDGEVELAPTRLGRLVEKSGIAKDVTREELTAPVLLEKLCKAFGMELEGPPTSEDRALAGVLYAVYLRRHGIVSNAYVFAKGVDITFISKVKERALEGVNITTSTSRQYNTNYAAHVLGRVGAIQPKDMEYYQGLGYPMDAYVGLDGVEKAFESHLQGTRGSRLIEKDESDNIINQEWRTQPKPGDNVVLTLNMKLQAAVEDLLEEYAGTLENPGGMAAVVVDMSGGVLSMASYPTYDLSTYADNVVELSQDTVRRPLVNRATNGLYAPGSTFKMVTAMGALSEGIIGRQDMVRCTGVYTFYPDVHPQCWIWPTGSHGNENVTQAITDSCNIFFYDVGRRLGISKLVEYATNFGLGQYTGIEISESKGKVASPETSAQAGSVWYGGEVMNAAIGQGDNQFTPLQLANYVATLVNGGNHYQAHLLKEVRSSDYRQTTYEYEPELMNTVQMDPDYLEAVKRGMYDLAKTPAMARYFSSLPVEVGCKTGTAEVMSSTANAVFVCFAPYDDPQIALCLVAERGGSGHSLAGVAGGILSQYFSTESSLDAVSGENTLLR